jgi:uncharacterized membrane protein
LPGAAENRKHKPVGVRRFHILKWIVAAAALGAVVVGAASLERSPRCTLIKAAGGVISIATADLSRGQARVFCYRDAGQDIRFILARASDGTVHSVFDACHRCYRYRKGYRLGRSGLICRLCGNRYTVDHMMAGKASCVPIAIPHKEAGATVEISATALRGGRGLF